MDVLTAILSVASALAWVTLGGGLYEAIVVDPVWPLRPDLIQPSQGGLSRKRFWICAHTCFEVALGTSLWIGWSSTDVRRWLFLALFIHATMRLWSLFDFIPKALNFERSGDFTAVDARRWTRRSRMRLLMDLGTCTAMLMALLTAAAYGASAP